MEIDSAGAQRALRVAGTRRRPGGIGKCGKQRAYEELFLDVWQTKGLPAKSWKCGKERA